MAGIELVDGYAGRPHISGDDLGSYRWAADCDAGAALYAPGSPFEPFDLSITGVREPYVSPGAAIMPRSGRYVRLTTSQTVDLPVSLVDQDAIVYIRVSASTTGEDGAPTSPETAEVGVAAVSPGADMEVQVGEAMPLWRIPVREGQVDPRQVTRLFRALLPSTASASGFAAAAGGVAEVKSEYRNGVASVFVDTGEGFSGRKVVATLPDWADPVEDTLTAIARYDAGGLAHCKVLPASSGEPGSGGKPCILVNAPAAGGYSGSIVYVVKGSGTPAGGDPTDLW